MVGSVVVLNVTFSTQIITNGFTKQLHLYAKFLKWRIQKDSARRDALEESIVALNENNHYIEHLYALHTTKLLLPTKDSFISVKHSKTLDFNSSFSNIENICRT